MKDTDKAKYFVRTITLWGALVLVVGSLSFFKTYLSLITFGVKASATVTRKDVVKSPRYANPEDQHENHEIDYFFMVRDKKIKIESKVISESNWEKIEVDQQIEVLYSKGNPEKTIPVMETGWKTMLQIFAGFVLGAYGVYLGFTLEPRI